MRRYVNSFLILIIPFLIVTQSFSATAPTITKQPVSKTVNVGQSASFSITATGTSPLSYQWKFGSSNISGATAATYSIASVKTSNAGSYTCVVKNTAGSKTSNAATLTVNTPPTITTQPVSKSVNVGNGISFIISATGTAPLSYQWKKNNVNISGATSATYKIASPRVSDAGTYSCTVTNNVGNTTSNGAVLTIDPSNNSPLAIGPWRGCSFVCLNGWNYVGATINYTFP